MSEAETFTFTCSDGTAYQIPVEADGVSFNVNNGSTYFGGVEASLVMADSRKMPEQFDQFCIMRPPILEIDSSFDPESKYHAIKSFDDPGFSVFAIGEDYCEVCNTSDILCLVADNSGDDYAPAGICTNCITAEVAKYHAKH